MRSNLVALAVSSALAATLASQAQAAEATAESGSGIEATSGVQEIVVTAERRSESIQSVPLSVTALDTSTMERMGLSSLKDLAREVPGLTVVSSGPGQNILIVRGISSTAGTTATVGYYLDDTPIQASSNAALLSARGVVDPALFDLARVEVLRGPQGTLYGSSSMGGTIKYVTNQPDPHQFSAKVANTTSYTDGGGPNDEVTGTVNLPLADFAALRVSAFYRHNDGFIDRYPIDPHNYLGTNGAAGIDRRVNSENTDGVRAVLRFDVTPTLSITPSVIYQETRLGGPFNFDSPQGSFSNLIQARDTPEQSTQKTWIGNVTVRKSFDSFELMSATSYYDRDIVLHEDASNVLAFYFSPPQTYVFPAGMTGDYRNKEWTQEGRFTSSFQGPLQVTGGLFYHYVEAPLESEIPDPPGYDAAFGSPFGGQDFFHGERRASLREYAGYGEVSYRFLDSFKATAGVRVFRVNQTFYQEGDGVFVGPTPSQVYGTSSDTGANPKFTIAHEFDADDMMYVTASKGYRPGGPNNPAPALKCGAEVARLGLSQDELNKYKSDSLWNYELGAKTRWLDRRVTVNGSVYYIDWTDVQQQLDLTCGFNITANFGKAKSKGAELEVSVAPATGLTFTASGGYTDATLGNAIPGTAARSGDRLLDVPRWSAAVSGQYERSLASTMSGFVRVDVTDRDGANALYDRTSPFYHYDGFALVNLRFGLEQLSSWKAELFLNNAFNKIGETALPVAIAADLATTRRIAVNTPRTVGITLQHEF